MVSRSCFQFHRLTISSTSERGYRNESPPFIPTSPYPIPCRIGAPITSYFKKFSARASEFEQMIESAWKSSTRGASRRVSQIHGEVRNSETFSRKLNEAFAGKACVLTRPDSIARAKDADLGAFLGSIVKTRMGQEGPKTLAKCKTRGARWVGGRASIIVAILSACCWIGYRC